MRLLQIIPSISLVYGGPSQMVRGFAQGLAAAGAEVTILTTNSNGDSGQRPLDVPRGVPVAEDNYTVRYFACSPGRRYKFSLGLLRWLHQHAQEYDLAHIHALFSPLEHGGGNGGQVAAATLHPAAPRHPRPSRSSEKKAS